MCQRGELVERNNYVRGEQTDFLYANVKDLIEGGKIYIRLTSLSLVFFRILVCRLAGVLSSQVKYDIFRNEDEGTWQKHLEE